MLLERNRVSGAAHTPDDPFPDQAYFGLWVDQGRSLIIAGITLVVVSFQHHLLGNFFHDCVKSNHQWKRNLEADKQDLKGTKADPECVWRSFEQGDQHEKSVLFSRSTS